MIQTRRVFRRRRSIRRARDRFEVLEGRRVLASYFVDTNIDIDARICAPDNAAGNIDCAIRFAILAAEDSPGPDTVRIPDGTYLIDAISFGSFDVSGGRSVHCWQCT